MSHARYLIGDVFDRMAELPDASVDLVLTCRHLPRRVGDLPARTVPAGLASYANEVDIVIFDLPGGWTEAQGEVIGNFVDVIFAVAPPTATALSDHEAHVAHILKAIPAAQGKVRSADKRRKIEFPEIHVYSVQTLTGYIGTLPNGQVATVRRLDAVSVQDATGAFASCGVPFAATVPPAVDVKALSETDEIGALADLVMTAN